MSKKFWGYWRIVEMELWDRSFIDAEVEGFIKFSKNGNGEFQFGYVHGFIDYQISKLDPDSSIEFSWEGSDEIEPTFGRGFASLESGNLIGCIYFHQGEHSGFKAIKK